MFTITTLNPYAFPSATHQQNTQLSFADYLSENNATAPMISQLPSPVTSPTTNISGILTSIPTSALRPYRTKGNITFIKRSYPSSRLKGVKKEVYAFKNPNDLIDMQRYFLYDCSKREPLRLRNWLFFALGINMGFRVSDLCKLRWENIFVPHTSSFNNNDWNQLTETKTGKSRQVVLNPAAQKAITYYIQSLALDPASLDPRSYVFWSNKKSEPHLKPDSIHDWIKKAARHLDLPFNVGTHSMRKTFGYMLYKSSGNDLGLVQEALNHSNTKTTLRYINITQEVMREAYNAIPDMVWTPT